MAEIAGLKLIVPSSVAGSGVSVSASGKVTFTAATSVSVNGVFDSTYDNYLVVIRHVASAATTLRFRMRASGTDNATASSYTLQRLTASGTSVTGTRNSYDFSFGPTATSSPNGSHYYVYGPALAQPTALRSVNVDNNGSARILDGATTHNQSVSYDGISFFPSSGDVTGALTIYGLSQ